jgi:hypothetical protein
LDVLATNPTIRLPEASSSGLYLGFEPKAERIARGCYITTCRRCQKLIGHWPQDSAGHEIICVNCANEIPAIRRHLDELSKARGD